MKLRNFQTAMLVLLAVASLATTVLIGLAIAARNRQAGPATLYEQPMPLPAFTLTDQDGKAVSLDDLSGKVWIADFIFTRCPGMCPAMTSQMYLLQERLKGLPQWKDMHLVSITVDPAHDTPQRMKAYSEMTLAEPGRWLFLTGEHDAVRQLIRHGFKLVADDAPAGAAEPIVHSSKFVLVDRDGGIRGYYDGLIHEDREALVADLGRLLNTRIEPVADEAQSTQTGESP